MEADRFLLLAGAVVYGFALAPTLYFLLRRRPPPHQFIFGVVLIGFGLQSIGLHLRGMAVGSCPVGNPFEILQFISWSIILIYIFTGTIFRATVLGTMSAMLAGLLGLLSAAVPGWDEDRTFRPLGGNPWIESHAALAFLSYGVFGLLAVTSVIYLLQNHSLKEKRWASALQFLPSIVQLEAVHFRLLSVACGIFTISIGIGLMYWVSTPDPDLSGKLLVMTALWAAYLGVWVLRMLQRLYGMRLAWINITLFMVALLSIWVVEAYRPSPGQNPTSPSAHAEPSGPAIRHSK